MATIDDAGMIRQIIRANGIYPEDPQAYRIYGYVNNWGKRTHSIIYDERYDDLYDAPDVHNPVLLWSAASGITDAGKRFINGAGW